MKKILVYIMFFIILFYEDSVSAKETLLQTIIDATSPYDTITLQEGTYYGPAVITHPLTIEGEGDVIIQGNFEGNVLTIESDRVQIKNVTIRQSGQQLEDAGILIQQANEVLIDRVRLEDVQRGIFIRGGFGHTLSHNKMMSFPVHYSKRGNGIHLLNTKQAIVINNNINAVQDGIYVDEAFDTKIEHNVVKHSRYGIHFMFSSNAEAHHNTLTENVNGVMAMNSNHIQLINNELTHQLTYRGYGVLIYDMESMRIEHNTISNNHNGIDIQSSRDIEVVDNTIAGNYVGLSSKGKNESIRIVENDWLANIVQTKLSGEAVQLERNYWDDYKGFDLTGNGVGQLPYETNSTTTDWMVKHPHLQFYFESPAFNLWNTVERMFNRGKVVTDEQPLVRRKGEQ